MRLVITCHPLVALVAALLVLQASSHPVGPGLGLGHSFSELAHSISPSLSHMDAGASTSSHHPPLSPERMSLDVETLTQPTRKEHKRAQERNRRIAARDERHVRLVRLADGTIVSAERLAKDRRNAREKAIRLTSKNNPDWVPRPLGRPRKPPSEDPKINARRERQNRFVRERNLEHERVVEMRRAMGLDVSEGSGARPTLLRPSAGISSDRPSTGAALPASRPSEAAMPSRARSEEGASDLAAPSQTQPRRLFDLNHPPPADDWL